jgi:hypothetical protein
MISPSRSLSNGRQIPDFEAAVMLTKPWRATGVIDASDPPLIITSQRPSMMSRAALPMAWVPAAQAVTVVSQGPCSPKRIEMPAAPALAIIMGTRKGETRRGSFWWYVRIWSSSVSRPPTPVPMSTPARAGLTPRSPACSTAMEAAAMAIWAKRSMRRASLGESK